MGIRLKFLMKTKRQLQYFQEQCWEQKVLNAIGDQNSEKLGLQKYIYIFSTIDDANIKL